jgi:cell division septal protein FtsQ
VAGWAGWALAGLPVFKLKSVSVTGLAHVTRADVLARAALDPEANVWLLDRRAIEARIEAIPYVDTARVHLTPPAAVWIEIAERTPDACVRDGAGRALAIDATQRILQNGCSAGTPVYVLRAPVEQQPGAVLRDPELRALEADASALGASADRYLGFAHDRFGELEATLENGIRVRFGDDDDLDRKQRLIDPILAELGPRAGEVVAVDVRAPAAPVVEYRAPPAPAGEHRK